MPDYAARWERARRLAEASGVDALHMMSGPNFRWFSGLVPHTGGWPVWATYIVVSVDGEPGMLVSQMHADLLDLANSPIKRVEVYMDGQDPVPALRRLYGRAGLDRATVGVEDGMWFGDVELIRSAMPEVTLKRGQPLFDELRSVKDADEIALIRRAARIHDAGYQVARTAIRVGTTVGRAGLEIIAAMVEAGDETMEIAGLFKALSDRKFVKGDIVDVDLWPGSFEGYRADSARNVFVGEPTKEAAKLYELTREAFNAAVSVVRPGTRAEDVHRACREVIESGGRKQVWKVGHGGGLNNSHEAPLLQEGNERLLE